MLAKLDSYMQNNQTELLILSYTIWKINSEGLKTNVRPKTIKLSRKHGQNTLWHFGLSNIFFAYVSLDFTGMKTKKKKETLNKRHWTAPNWKTSV